MSIINIRTFLDLFYFFINDKIASIKTLNTSVCITDSLNKVRVLKNDEVLLLDKSNKLTLDNQTINDLLEIINAMDAEIPYAEYTKQEFDKYLNSIVYKP